jgi:hypothetical protein
MTKQYENVSLVVAKDYRIGGKIYEYVITADDGEVLLARKGGFRSTAAAKKAGVAAAQEFIAPTLF